MESTLSGLIKNLQFVFCIFILHFFLIGCQVQKEQSDLSEESDTLQVGKPESVGMSSERLARIDHLLLEYIEEKKLPGATCLIARHGKVVYHKSFGYRDIELRDSLQVEDIYRIASMTKAVTTVAFMMLYEEGHFLLDDPISNYIPEFKNPVILQDLNEKDSTYVSSPSKKEITIRQLLNHTSGIGYGGVDKRLGMLYSKSGIIDGGIAKTGKTLEESVRDLAKMPLLHEPGEKFLYGLNTDVVGYLIEIISGQKLDKFFQDKIFAPIGMEDTYFSIPGEKKERFVTLYEDARDFDLRRSENDQYNYVLETEVTYLSGGGGLVSTALDYGRFLQMLLNDGKYDGVQFLSRKTIDLMTSNQVGELWGDRFFGLGFGITTARNTADLPSSEGSYWWSGIYNTRFWVDPSEGLVAVFMTQMHPIQHYDIHDKFQILTYQAIAD